MVFNITNRTRKLVAGLLAAGVLGGTVAGGLALSQGAPANTPPSGTVHAVTARSTVPKPVTRAETAAEDVIGFLEQGKLAKSKAEARILRGLAHGKAADALRRAKVPDREIKAFQQRADRTARLSLADASPIKVSLAANSVSRLMPGFYARYQDPVPPAVLRLDYLDREVQLRSQAGQASNVRQAIRQLEATWRQLRPQLVTAGGANVAKAYDRHVTALKRGGALTTIQQETSHGLDIVDRMEVVFLGR